MRIFAFIFAVTVATWNTGNARLYTVSDVVQNNGDGTNCSRVLFGLVSTTAIKQVSSTDALSTTPGTAFEFLTSQITYQIVSLTACIDVCRQSSVCTAVQYQAACNGVAESCDYITTAGPLTLNSRGTTSTASCTSGSTTSGRSVYVKYCNNRPASIVLATNTWYLWSPWTACFKTDPTGETKTRRRFCNGNACICPSGTTCFTLDGVLVMDETANCTVACTDNAQVYTDYCNALPEQSEGFNAMPNQCNPCTFKACVRLQQDGWVVVDMECPAGKRYDSTRDECVMAASDEKCYVAECSKSEVNNDVRQYEENSTTQTCSSGLIFWLKECQCVPGPGVNIARQYMTSILCDGTLNDAGILFGSADPYPSGRNIQYSAAGTTVVNSMCRLVGASNTQAGGLKIGGISGLGEVLNPTFTLWFSASDTTASNSNKQMLLTNRELTVSPNVELYIQNGLLHFASANLETTPVQIRTNITQNTWYCFGVVFDHAATAKENITSLTIKIYLKEKGGSLTNPLSLTANSYTVTINNEDMKVGYSNSGTGTNVDEFFIGLVDSITFIRHELVTWTMMDQICAIAPDSY